MRVAVDIDEVVADLRTEWVARYNSRWNDNLNPEDITDWDMKKFAKKECGSRIFDILQDDDLYKHVNPIKGSQEGVERIRDLGHRVIFVTACVPNMIDQKFDWLDRNGFLVNRKRYPQSNRDVIIAKDKSLVDAQVLIDDNMMNCINFEEALPTRKFSIIFTQPYNRNFHWTWRMENWADLKWLEGLVF